MKNLFLTVTILFTLLEVLSFSQQPLNPRQMLDTALTALGSEEGWQADAVGSNLKAIVTSHSTSPEYPTARAILVSHLMETAKYAEALTLANAVLAITPVNWRNAWVAADKAAILGFQGKNAESLQAAKDALPIIDSATLGQVTDPDFLRLLQVTSAQRSDLKDGVLSMIAALLIKQGALTEADGYAAQIVDVKTKAHVQLYRQQR